MIQFVSNPFDIMQKTVSLIIASVLLFFLCEFTTFGLAAASAGGPATKSPIIRSKSGEIVRPLPDPPKLQVLIRSADIIVRARLLHSHQYRIGNRDIGQSRFVALENMKSANAFHINAGEKFTVTYRLRPGEWSGYFQRPPGNLEYVLFLQLKNVTIKKRIVGVVPSFFFPNAFALLDTKTEAGSIKKLERLLHADR